MKFIRKDQSVISFQDHLSVTKRDNSPIKEIIERKDLSDFYYVCDRTISFKDITQIQVNVIDVGVMIFTFESTSFNKELFIGEISKLKEIEINSFYDVLSKMKALYTSSEAFNPLFVIYVPNGKYRIFEDCFKTIVGNIKTLYVSETKDESILEGNTVTLPPKEKVKEQHKEKTKFSFKKTIEMIKKEKIHFLFSFVATLLLSITLSIGIYNAYSGKMLCIFFFICSLAGAFLNFMIYRDTYKQNQFKSMFNLLTVIFSILGLLLGFGVYMLFKAISKDAPVVTPHIILIIAMMIIVTAISMYLPLLINYLKKKK